MSEITEVVARVDFSSDAPSTDGRRVEERMAHERYL